MPGGAAVGGSLCGEGRVKLIIKITVGLFILIIGLAVAAFVAVLVFDPHRGYENNGGYGFIDSYPSQDASHG